MSRQIFKSARYGNRDAADVLQSLFAVELISPSRCLWLISAWISDIAILDNRGREFDGVDRQWSARQIRLTEVLVHLLGRGTGIVVASNFDPHNAQFTSRLERLASAAGVTQRLLIHRRDDLHEKGILGDDFFLHGSMNITHSGVEVLEEAITLDTDSQQVARAQIEYRERWSEPQGLKR